MPWSSYISEKSCHFNTRAITFTTTSQAVAILENSNYTAGHVPRDISWYFLQKSGSEMTCIVDVNGDYSASERENYVDT